MVFVQSPRASRFLVAAVVVVIVASAFSTNIYKPLICENPLTWTEWFLCYVI